ncbi:phosphoenolpyruvate carboxylase [Pedobacter sp. UYEF25]
MRRFIYLAAMLTFFTANLFSPNWLVKGFGLIVPIMKELAEMNYQYDRDYFFDSSKFNNYFNYTPTTHAIAVKQINDGNNRTTTS